MVVVGAGSGGMTVAIGLAAFGRAVALVEAGRVGGDCTNVGCVPSKRLIHLARDGAPGADALADVRAVRDDLADHERRLLDETANLELISGRARLTGPRTVEVVGPSGTRVIRARHVVLATGSRPTAVDVPGLPPARVLTNESVFEIDAVPAHLVVVGAGAIGLEMAMAMRRLGAAVTLVDVANRVLPAARAEVSAVLASRLDALGVRVLTGARAAAFDEADRTLTVETASGALPVEAVDAVLMAVGRRPNVDDLGLASAGVDHGPAGIAVDGWGRTNVRSVWAVGDVTVDSHQTHAANARGRRIVQRIGFPWLPPIGRPGPTPSAIFVDPEVAWVDAPRPRRRATATVRVDLAATDRGLTDGVDAGFVLIEAERLTGRIRHATVVGPAAGELVAVLTLAIDRGISMYRLSRLVWAYPTHAAAIGRAADDFARMTFGNMRGEFGAWLRRREKTT